MECSMQKPSRIVLAAFVVISLAAGPAAAACSTASGARTDALLELYTSEGCDSCPPADRWLSATFPPDANGGVVALAFHVDYWDRLGWKDRFASPSWTERQYASAHGARSSLVYTPQVLLQGRDFRGWQSAERSRGAFAAALARPARADIALNVERRADAVAVSATARVRAAGDRAGAALFVALADSGLVSVVKAGENAGKTLRHDHVVRALQGPFALAGGDVARDLVLPLPAERGTAMEVVAFVQNVETAEVLQALALPLGGACGPAR
jgi:hypothetical protein